MGRGFYRHGNNRVPLFFYRFAEACIMFRL